MDKHRKALELAGHAGCILLKNGAEIFRVQETMTRILCAYGVTDNNVYVISNGIFATEGEGTEHALSLVRHVPLGGVNLSRIDAVNAISREICEGRWTTDEAEALLTRAETLTPEKPLTHVFACALGAASFCYLFGGSLLDSAAAFPIGLLLQIYLFAAQKRRSGFMPYIWGSGLVTLLSGLLSALFPALSASWVVIGGIVPMVPGVTFTTSIREFFNGDYLSGVIHCICAMLTAVCIALGVCGGAMLLGFMGGIALCSRRLSGRAFVCRPLSCATQKLSRVCRLRCGCLGLLSPCRAAGAVSGHDAGRHRADAALPHVVHCDENAFHRVHRHRHFPARPRRGHLSHGVCARLPQHGSLHPARHADARPRGRDCAGHSHRHGFPQTARRAGRTRA